MTLPEAPLAGTHSGWPNVLGCCLNDGCEQVAPYSGVVFWLYFNAAMNCAIRASVGLSTNSW